MEKTMKTQTSIIVLITALASCLLLTSCDGENLIPDNETGILVNPSVTLSGFIEGGNQEITRSQSTEREPVKTAIPLGDGMLLEMSLEQDSRSSLRDATNFPNGTKFQVIAVKSGTNTYVSHGNFILDGATSLTNNEFWVPQGSFCDFICISYNSTTEAPPEPSYNPTSKALYGFPVPYNTDLSLLYDKITNEEIKESGPVLVFAPLQQKLAKVKLVIDGSYNEWTISNPISSGIYLNPSYSGVTMAYNTGALTAGYSQNMSFSWPNSAPNQTHTSNERTIVPNGSTPLKVYFPQSALSITTPTNSTPLGVPTHSASEVTFPSTVSLEAGKTYTLQIKLKTPIFAKSNIYWSGSKLTFDTITNNEKYQGVFFKWGSLVGLSPTGTDNASAYYFTPPTGISSGAWTKVLFKDSPNISNGFHWGNGYFAVPYCVDDYSNSFNIEKNYLYDTYSSDYSNHGYRGDICNYLNHKWRLPNLAEFGIAAVNWDISFPSSPSPPSPITPTNEDGKHNIVDRSISLKANNAFFPASGYPLLMDPSYVGQEGHYWSGTPVTGREKAYVLSFSSTSLDIDIQGRLQHTRSSLRSVRCVKI
jgi:hypothetical protein